MNKTDNKANLLWELDRAIELEKYDRKTEIDISLNIETEDLYFPISNDIVFSLFRKFLEFHLTNKNELEISFTESEEKNEVSLKIKSTLNTKKSQADIIDMYPQLLQMTIDCKGKLSLNVDEAHSRLITEITFKRTIEKYDAIYN